MNRFQSSTIVVTVLLALLTSNAPGAAVATRVIVISGDMVPDSNGRFTSFGNPVLNDMGQVAFLADLSSTIGGPSDDLGIFRGEVTPGNLTQIARKGQPAPDNNGAFADFDDPGLNEAGQIAFKAFLTSTNRGSNDDAGIFRGSGGPITQFAREGQAAPNLDANFSELIFRAFNNAGQVAFIGATRRLIESQGVRFPGQGIYRGDGIALTPIVRGGQSTPDDNRSFSTLGLPALNDAGQVAFVGRFPRLAGGNSAGVGIFRGDGGQLTQIARDGQAASDGNRGIQSIGFPSLNDSGQAAFLVFFQNDAIGFGTNQSILRGAGGTLTELVGFRQVAPDDNGRFNGFATPAHNDAGQSAFWAGLTGTSGGFGDDTGLYRDDGVGIAQIVREGQAAPDANGSFGNLTSRLALNNEGQLAFLANLESTSRGEADDEGIFLFDDSLGVVQVSRKGESFLGSTITDLSFGAGITSDGDEWNGLNEFGEVAYRFTLADGREGIAVTAIIPEPASLALLGLGGLGLAALRRGKRLT